MVEGRSRTISLLIGCRALVLFMLTASAVSMAFTGVYLLLANWHLVGRPGRSVSPAASA